MHRRSQGMYTGYCPPKSEEKIFGVIYTGKTQRYPPRHSKRGVRGAGPLNKIWPPARGLARHNKRFTIEEIIKIVATSCQILRLKCTKSLVGWGSAPDPARGAYSTPQTP